jgi:hypothetical protein
VGYEMGWGMMGKGKGRRGQFVDGLISVGLHVSFSIIVETALGAKDDWM